MLEWIKKFGQLSFETIKVVVISFAIILPIRYFLIQPFYVEGASMEPSFHSKEYLIIDELTYRLSDPQRGDVAVMRYPREPKQFFIKRIIGLPGERIELINGTVYVNSTSLAEEYVPEDASDDSMAEITLDSDEYFMLGDNRGNSLDSRVFGPVKRKYLIGRAWIRGWPIHRISVFGAPQY